MDVPSHKELLACQFPTLPDKSVEGYAATVQHAGQTFDGVREGVVLGDQLVQLVEPVGLRHGYGVDVLVVIAPSARCLAWLCSVRPRESTAPEFSPGLSFLVTQNRLHSGWF